MLEKTVFQHSFIVIVFLHVIIAQRNDYNTILRTAKGKLSRVYPPSQQRSDLFSELMKVSNWVSGFLVDSQRKPEIHALLAKKQFESVAGNVTVSEQCVNDTSYVISNVGEHWAKQMLDALGKPSSAILQGNLNFWGSYDECLSIHDINKTEYAGGFNTQYCYGSVVPANTTLVPNAYGMVAAVVIGMCLPDTCNQVEIEYLVNQLLKSLNVLTFEIQGVTCQPKTIEIDTKAIVAIIICSIVLLLLVIGTCFDIYLTLDKGGSGLKHALLDRQPSNNSTEKSVINESSPLLGHVSNKDTAEEAVIDQTEERLSHKRKTLSDSNQGTLARVFLSFSVYTNGAKILNTDQSKSTLRAVHGVRFLSMTWVMLGHSFAFGLAISDNIVPYATEAISRNSFSAVANAFVSVDSFFALSGLLVAYVVLGEMKKNGGKINWFMFYFHRFWRLTPVYMFVLMIDVCLLPYVGDGPFWPRMGIEPFCNESWWTNLLYVNNLVKSNEMCMGWSWYLANDMQFYVLSPLLLVPLFLSMYWGAIVTAVSLAIIWLTTGLISRLENLPPGPDYKGVDSNFKDYMPDYYFAPYCRMGPYIIGIAAGYILYITNKNIRINKLTALLGWCIASGSALAVVYGLYDYANGSFLDKDASAFYNTVHRTVWGACVSWVIVACGTGHGGYINTILSWKGFIPLSRLTYCAYLVHPLIMFLYYYSARTPIYMNDSNLIYLFFGHLIASYGIAFIVSLVCEVPMMGLEKAILKPGKIATK